ncbi:hypothetical protein ACFYPK_01125 [Streptomyces halstedii]
MAVPAPREVVGRSVASRCIQALQRLGAAHAALTDDWQIVRT